MAITQRYQPEHPPGDACTFGLDFSQIIPVGVGIKSGTLAIMTNTATPSNANADWGWNAATPLMVRGRAVYASLQGGVLGQDYQFRWTANDTDDNVWTRVGLILCGYTS